MVACSTKRKANQQRSATFKPAIAFEAFTRAISHAKRIIDNNRRNNRQKVSAYAVSALDIGHCAGVKVEPLLAKDCVPAPPNELMHDNQNPNGEMIDLVGHLRQSEVRLRERECVLDQVLRAVSRRPQRLLPRHRSGKECRGYRAFAATPARRVRFASVFLGRLPPVAGRNLRACAFLLRRTPACHCRGTQRRFRRHCVHGNCGREFCNRYASGTGTLISRRARRAGDDRIWTISSKARSGCATGSKDRRWIGQGPNSWSFKRCSSVP